MNSFESIGISLGTTNACMAMINNDVTSVIPNQEGELTTPIMVSYSLPNKRFIGAQAKNRAIISPETTLYGITRFIGKSFFEVSTQYQINAFPFLIVNDPLRNGAAALKVNGKNVYPSEIIAEVLMYLKAAAEKYIAKPVKNVVISVPVYFDDSQRQETKDACNIAGLEVLRIINEPTAAALVCGVDNGLIAVYDFGGGTFNISILDVQDGVFELLATNGDLSLGGENVNEAIVDYLIKKIESVTKLDLKNMDKEARLSPLQKIRIEADNTKKALSNITEYEINLPYLAMKEGIPINFSYTFKRSELEDISKKFIDKTIKPCQKAMADANIKPSDIGKVISVGGMTRMPLVQKTIGEIFGKKASCSVNPEHIAAIGAAVQAKILGKQISNE